MAVACSLAGDRSGSPRGTDHRADVAAIRAARAAQNRAIAEGDLEQISRYWTDDVTGRRGLGAAVTGRDAHRQLFEPRGPGSANVVYQRMTSAVEVSQRWPLAFETGSWSGRLGNALGPQIIGGRYSAQWVRRGGNWLIRSEVFVALSCEGSGCDAAAIP